MFKALGLQRLHNLPDDRIECPIRDRLSFMRFLGLQLEDRVTDAAVHDSPIYADSAYRAKAQQARLAAGFPT